MEVENYKALRAHWYAILQSEGFIDIENTKREDSPLIDWHSLRWFAHDHDEMKDVCDYYTRAQALTNTYDFQNELHKRIWEYHCDGRSLRQIEVLIDNTLKRVAIGNIIKVIEGAM